jgi:transposase
MKTQGISTEKLLGIIEEKDQRIAELEQQIQWLISQVSLAKHKQFGTSSEQTDSAQLPIFNEAELNADLTASEPDLTEVKAHHRKKRTRLTTDKLPKDLPVEVIEYELPAEDCVCPDCGSELHTMGREINSDHVPIVKADMPEPVIKGGFASPETIAHIAVRSRGKGKYLNYKEIIN